MAVALLALFVALGGSAVAARIAVNSVKSKHIANGQVKRKDLGLKAVNGARLADRAVTGPKLAPGAILGDHVADDALSGADIDESSLGVVPAAATSARADGLATPEGDATAVQLMPDARSQISDPSPDIALTSSETTVIEAAVVSQLRGNWFIGSASLSLYSGSGFGSANCYVVDEWSNPISAIATATFSATGERVQLPVIGATASLQGELPSGDLSIRCIETSGDVRFDEGTMFVLTVPTYF